MFPLSSFPFSKIQILQFELITWKVLCPFRASNKHPGDHTYFMGESASVALARTGVPGHTACDFRTISFSSHRTVDASDFNQQPPTTEQVPHIIPRRDCECGGGTLLLRSFLHAIDRFSPFCVFVRRKSFRFFRFFKVLVWEVWGFWCDPSSREQHLHTINRRQPYGIWR